MNYQHLLDTICLLLKHFPDEISELGAKAGKRELHHAQGKQDVIYYLCQVAANSSEVPTRPDQILNRAKFLNLQELLMKKS